MSAVRFPFVTINRRDSSLIVSRGFGSADAASSCASTSKRGSVRVEAIAQPASHFALDEIRAGEQPEPCAERCLLPLCRGRCATFSARTAGTSQWTSPPEIGSAIPVTPDASGEHSHADGRGHLVDRDERASRDHAGDHSHRLVFTLADVRDEILNSVARRSVSM